MRTLAILAALAVLPAAPVCAEKVTIDFSGVLSAGLYLGGTKLSGRTSYDSSMQPYELDVADNYALYDFPAYNVYINKKPLNVYSKYSGVLFDDGNFEGLTIPVAFTANSLNSHHLLFSLQFTGTGVDAIHDFQLPTWAELSKLHGEAVALNEEDGVSSRSPIDLSITAPTPEPGTWATMICGIALAAYVGRRRARLHSQRAGR